MHPLSIRQFIRIYSFIPVTLSLDFIYVLSTSQGHIGTRERKQTDRHRQTQTDRHRQTQTDRHRQRVSGVTRLKETDSDRQRKSEGEWIDKN